MEYLTYFTQIIYGFSGKPKSKSVDHFNKLKVDIDTGNPNKAWKRRVKDQHCSYVVPMNPKIPAKQDHVRFVCISDTHTKLEKLKSLEIPNGDVLLHAGDFSMYGRPEEVHIFNEFLGNLPHKHKVVIAGNHDITFDLDLMNYQRSSWIWSMMDRNYESELRFYGASGIHDLLQNCIYLQDSMVELYGFRIYGSPWTPSQYKTWGFQLPRGEGLLEKWNEIPGDIDILLTHCPPCGFGDTAHDSYPYKMKKMLGLMEEDHTGCVDLLNTVQRRVKPRYHVYGHIHEGYGIKTDGTTTYVNASTCTKSYEPTNPPIVFDVPIPPGCNKRPQPIGKEQPK